MQLSIRDLGGSARGGSAPALLLCQAPCQPACESRRGWVGSGRVGAIKPRARAQVLMTRPREEWKVDVLSRYKALEQFSKEDARLQFLRILRSLPYGARPPPCAVAALCWGPLPGGSGGAHGIADARRHLGPNLFSLYLGSLPVTPSRGACLSCLKACNRDEGNANMLFAGCRPSLLAQ